MTEPEYRQKVQEVFTRIDRALAQVDPDLVECEQSQGSFSLTFKNRFKCILSAQPSVQQLWIAMAALGTAHHFNYDPNLKSWFDDKGQGIEVIEWVRKCLKDLVNLDVEV